MIKKGVISTNQLVHIGNSDISIKEYNGQRVVTFKDIDMVHGRPDGTASRNFRTNRERFIEGEDFFRVSADEIRRTKIFDIPDKATSDYALMTEQGYLMLVKSFTDNLAWDVQRQLVNGYFKTREKVKRALSPELQMLQGLLSQMVEKELADKERDRQILLAKETADKAVATTENIKEAVKPVFDNWRSEINLKFNRIQKCAGAEFRMLRTEMYQELERRAGCDLSTRLRNKRNRMQEKGCTKTTINALNKMDIIDDDKKLREIFSKIVTEYEIKYCA
nr:MAG TPA: hypothetical protein [Caudoviricetes sp.]